MVIIRPPMSMVAVAMGVSIARRLDREAKPCLAELGKQEARVRKIGPDSGMEPVKFCAATYTMPIYTNGQRTTLAKPSLPWAMIAFRVVCLPISSTTNRDFR